VLSGSSCCWFQAEWIIVRSASKPNVKVAPAAAGANAVSRRRWNSLNFPGLWRGRHRGQSLPREIGSGRQKSRPSLWPRQTVSRQEFAAPTETGSTTPTGKRRLSTAHTQTRHQRCRAAFDAVLLCDETRARRPRRSAAELGPEPRPSVGSPRGRAAPGRRRAPAGCPFTGAA
jgi:hypothetical protein